MERSTAPRIVGRYALYDVIAIGGMASVHLGRLNGPVGFSRTVAIKRLHEQFAKDPDFVAMFMDEARIVARIRHPNVVPTLDVVALDDDLLIVMDYVAGESLFQLIKHGRATRTPTPIPILVDIMVGVLHGLHAAHEATNEMGEPLGIVHRDISPQNIVVGTDGVARVLDFGVAKALGRSQCTEAGQIKGKLRYMAPEQIHGEGVNRMADVYAASIVLWEALTGRPYLVAETSAELMFRALNAEPTPPSSLRPDVSPAIDEVVLRGLERDPAKRHPSARAMADALQAAVTPIARSVVADWVVQSARTSIDGRARLVAEVESDVTVISTPLPGPPRGVPAAAPSEPSSASLERSLSSSPPRPPSRVPQFIALAAAATVLGGVAALVLHRSATTPSTSEVTRPAPAASPAMPEPVAPGPSASAPASAAAAPPPTASASASTSAAMAPREKRRVPSTKPVAPRDPPPPDPIYVRD